ncbi:plasmid mobilization relaxosome protein MobC [Chitinophaga oryzae]|uniref:Plasmid mobilization relaxosome protein MobC n=1 Tax=Chitinophaga oryzae TaxID=2725414 RepID=A0AAE6ZKG0_9BACT|nr:plasmid mobilization relaxosome protein MobC [Chitinophaga oryzae]QJB34884.1 plasmid mobilization relaxosome protein MobC [Chitinophaga oryzae]QJB41395.1 plasmid mobilization relaxosome protein MobC [Chitinophaga oryzae]
MIMEREKKSKGLQLPHVVPIRISKEKHRELSDLLQHSHCRSMSELLRNIIDNRKIVVEHWDQGSRLLLEELALIRKEIQSIGVNINQATRRVNSEKQPADRISHALDIVRFFHHADERITRLFTLMAKLSERW